MRVVVTGATGFVGARLCKQLQSDGMHVTAVVRPGREQQYGHSVDVVVQADLLDLKEMPPADVVIHLAGVAHNPSATEHQYIRGNVGGTEAVVRAAERSGIRRIVFMSSVKAMGEGSRAALRSDDMPKPGDAYGRSKLAAEAVVRTFRGEWVIVRTPLVYGPGVKGNFLRLLEAVAGRRPLPLGSIRNHRSLLYLDNCTAALKYLASADVVNRVALISDGPPIATPDLIKTIARHMGVPSRLVPIPLPLMQAIALVIGKRAELHKLAGDLVIDHAHATASLGWQPPYSFEQGIEQTVKWFRSSRDVCLQY